MISAIILAGGLSSRMGSPKQLLKLENRTFINIVTQNVLASKVDEVIVVTGYKNEEVSNEISGLPVKVIYNPDYSQGQWTSLAAGVRAVNPKTEAWLVFMCDQPLITHDINDYLIRKYKESKCLALRPTYQGRPGHPVILSGQLLNRFKTELGDEGARSLLAALGSDMLELPVQDEAVILDIDTLESYERLKTRLSLRKG